MIGNCLKFRPAWTVLLAISSLALIAGMSASAATPKKNKPFSDHFNKDKALNPGWTLVLPNSASSYSLSKKGLLLDGSGQNGGSDLWPSTNYNASLLLQPISASLNWTITIKEKFSPLNFYQGAGIVLTTQTSGFTTSSEFHRFEYGNYLTQSLQGHTNGAHDPDQAAYTGTTVEIQLQKSGSTYTYSYSPNGKNWTKAYSVTDSNPYTYVGIDAIRYPYDGMTTVDANPVFQFFKIKIAH
jgi:hypothetical protein